MADNSAELIERLLKSGKLSRETREEMGEFKQQLAKGELDPVDQRYIESLVSRLLGGKAADAANDDGEIVDDGEEELDDNLWELDEDAELQAWRERAEKAELRVTELEAEVAALKARLGDSES